MFTQSSHLQAFKGEGLVFYDVILQFCSYSLDLLENPGEMTVGFTSFNIRNDQYSVIILQKGNCKW